MPLQPKHLDYENAQFLVIGEGSGELSKATEPQDEDEKHEKDTPLEELEKLEHEDEIRAEHLKGECHAMDVTLLRRFLIKLGDDSVFEDLGLSSNEYPKVPTTW